MRQEPEGNAGAGGGPESLNNNLGECENDSERDQLTNENKETTICTRWRTTGMTLFASFSFLLAGDICTTIEH